MNLLGPGFVALAIPRVRTSDEGEPAARFREETGQDPELVLETPSCRVLAAGSSVTTVARDPSGRTALAVHGDLWGAGTGTTADLLHMYQAAGDGFAKDVHGSWAGLLVDAADDRVLFYTDRLNSRRLFHRPTRDGHWVATDLARLPTRGVPPDPVGVAWYLSNGVVHCGRTPLEGVSVLDGASAHELRDGCLDPMRYWRFPYSGGGSQSDETGAGNELLCLIRAAVERAAPDTEPVWLSLSGGYDSVCIAAVLGELVDRDVRCVSYAHGAIAEDSDAAVARDAATMLGLRHLHLEAYGGDFGAHIDLNARLGQGMANACDEVDAWVSLGRGIGEAKSPVLLVGDHFLPASPDRRVPADERPPPGKLWGPEVVGWLAPRVGAPLAEGLDEGVTADIARLADEAAGEDRTRGYYFFEQRLPNVLLSWRHMFAGRFFRVRNPLLDLDVLDFTSTLSREVRRSSYYHDAIGRAFPELFGRPRARVPGYRFQLQREIVRHAAALRRVTESGSALDTLVPPATVRWMLERVTEGRRWTRRAAARLGMGRSENGSSVDPPGAGSRRFNEATVLRRYLILREALERAAE